MAPHTTRGALVLKVGYEKPDAPLVIQGEGEQVGHAEHIHSGYDLEDYGELFAHLTDDHDFQTAQVAAMSFNEREREHRREHA